LVKKATIHLGYGVGSRPWRLGEFRMGGLCHRDQCLCISYKPDVFTVASAMVESARVGSNISTYMDRNFSSADRDHQLGLDHFCPAASFQDPNNSLSFALKSGTYEDRLVLRDVGTGQFWEAMVTAHVEESEEATEAARLILFTNTARSIDLNLDINTGRSGKYFVLIEHPQLLPGQVYAYVPQGKLVPFSSYGFPAPNAGDLFLAEDVDNISIRLGQVNLVGLEGSLKVHVDRSTTTDLVPVQEIFYNIDSLSGDWLISDTFKGVAYPEYSAVLHEGFGLFSGTWWDGCNATVHYSPEGWYVVEFYDQYFSYRYEVRAIGTDTLSGFWSYSGAPDKQYPFTGRKKGNLFPISPQINGKWIFSSEEESCCCPFLPGIFEGQVTMAKTGDQVSLSMDAGDLKGTIEGNEMRLSGVWFLDDGYTLSIRASATLTEDGAMLYGTSCWILSSYELSCEGTSIFRGSR